MIDVAIACALCEHEYDVLFDGVHTMTHCPRCGHPANIGEEGFFPCWYEYHEDHEA